MTYLLVFASCFENRVKVAPKLFDLIGVFHIRDNVNCVARLVFLLQFTPAQHFFILHVSHASKIVHDPLIKVKAPMIQSMSTLGIGLAGPIYCED